jgi:hypothetical protein
MRIITALSATGLAAGLALTGAQAANADVTLPPGGALEQRITSFCGRVPDLLERIDKAQTRIGADAETKGSLSWLKAKQAKAEAKGRKRVVKRLERRIDRRTERLAKLPKLKQKLTAAQTECATLDLPSASGS